LQIPMVEKILGIHKLSSLSPLLTQNRCAACKDP
jgi:hypothetical protein